MIDAARSEGVRVTVETCPHYSTFAAEEIPDGDPRFKCAPPIRGWTDRDRLWNGLGDRSIDTIGSDHSPAPPHLKHLASGDLARAWGGIASLQLMLPSIWTEARQRGHGPADLMRWMALNPAWLVGLNGRKGAIAPGCDADLVVFDPDATFVVTPDRLFQRHKATPYEGRTLSGLVEATWLRGHLIFQDGRLLNEPRGRTVTRKNDRKETPT